MLDWFIASLVFVGLLVIWDILSTSGRNVKALWGRAFRKVVGREVELIEDFLVDEKHTFNNKHKITFTTEYSDGDVEVRHYIGEGTSWRKYPSLRGCTSDEILKLIDTYEYLKIEEQMEESGKG